MNLLKLDDFQLADLRQATINETRRRTQIAVNGHDAAAVVFGNEWAKRAVSIAAAGHHSILFVGPSNCGKTMLRGVCMELGVEETYEARPCPCGNAGDPISDCRCTVKQIQRTVANFPAVDIAVQVYRPREREQNFNGTSLAQMREYIDGMTHFTPEDLEESGANLLKAASREYGLDIVAVARILGVGRTIANLDHSEQIRAVHISEAINYRALRAFR